MTYEYERLGQISAHGADLNNTPLAKDAKPAADPLRLSTPDLLKEVGDQVVLLVRKEVELAQSEAKQDLQTERMVAIHLGVAGVCALLGITFTLLTVVFAMSRVIEPWLSALILAVALLATAGIIGYTGWTKRVKNPLATTQRTLKEDVRWAKQSLMSALKETHSKTSLQG